MKICTKCKITKPYIEFYKDASTKDGHHPWCKDHRRPSGDPLAKAEYDRKYRPQKRWEKKANFFNTTVEFLKSLLASQNSLCAICQKPEVNKHRTGCVMTLAIDHDHEKGHIRGFLCQKCNQGLGMFLDSPELLIKAASYLVTRKNG